MSAVAFVRKMGIVGRLSLILLACLAVVAIVSIPQLFHKVGAWSSEPSLNTVVCAAGGNQASPVTISDGSGGAIIAWHDCRSGNSWDVYIQRMDSTGSAQWTANGIAVCTASHDQVSPVVVSDGSGGAIIAWQDRRSYSYDIYAQRVDSSGGSQWTANGVPICTASYDQVSPVVVSDGSGGAIIAWQDRRSCGYDIYAQRVDSSGSPLWTANGVSICTASRDQISAAAASDGSGGAVITWQDKRGCNYDIYAQRVDSSGGSQWTTGGVGICTAVGCQMKPAIVSDASGLAVIAWQDYRSGTNYDLYGQQVNLAGATQWSAGGMAICDAAYDQTSAAAMSDGSGGAIIAWQDSRTGVSKDIYAQSVNSTGSPRWSTGGVAICIAAEDQDCPITMSDASSGAIIAWQDARSNTGLDIYGQRVSPEGTTQWTANGAAISTASGDQSSLSGVSDGAGGAIVAWQDSRNVTKDIYAQRVFASGVLSQPPKQPRNLSPVDGATDISLTPALRCSAFSTAESGDTHAASQWRIRTAASDYDSPVFDSSSDPFALRQVTLELGYLDGNITYYWQVRHQDEDGEWSLWSEETCFTTCNRAPDQPSGFSPGNGEIDISLTPTLHSSAFSDPDAGDAHTASQWRISAASGDYSVLAFLSDEATTDLTQVSVAGGFLTGNTTYFWQVRHKDNHGSWSDWSDEKSFRTLNRPPDRPAPILPAAGATGTDLSLTLESSAFSDPDSGDAHAASQWQLTTMAGDYGIPVFDTVKLTESNPLSVVVPPCTLAPDTTYYWRVRYQDEHGAWSDWSEESSFITLEIPDNHPPDQPACLVPGNGSKNISRMPTIESSTFHDPDAGDSHASSQWQITTMPGEYANPVLNSAAVVGTAPTSIVVPSCVLSPGTTYYWRIRYQDNHGAWSDWSEESSFTTQESPDNTPPDQPTCVAPRNGAENVSTTPTLKSSAFHDSDADDSQGASQWQVTGTPGDYSDPTIDKLETLNSISFPDKTLSPETTYCWRVRHQDSHGAWSEWSYESSFATEAEETSGTENGMAASSWIYLGVVAAVAILAAAAVAWRNARANRMAGT